jgi:hypothetical protein
MSGGELGEILPDASPVLPQEKSIIAKAGAGDGI